MASGTSADLLRSNRASARSNGSGRKTTSEPVGPEPFQRDPARRGDAPDLPLRVAADLLGADRLDESFGAEALEGAVQAADGDVRPVVDVLHPRELAELVAVHVTAALERVEDEQPDR